LKLKGTRSFSEFFWYLQEEFRRVPSSRNEELIFNVVTSTGAKRSGEVSLGKKWDTELKEFFWYLLEEFH